MPSVVRDQADEHGPADAAGGVQEEEPPPLHPAHAREPRRRYAEHGDEAADEDRLGAVLPEEPFRPRERARSVPLEPAPSGQDPAAVGPADPVAGVVAEDRGRGRDDDDGDDVEPPARREYARGDERRLAGKRNPGG